MNNMPTEDFSYEQNYTTGDTIIGTVQKKNMGYSFTEKAKDALKQTTGMVLIDMARAATPTVVKSYWMNERRKAWEARNGVQADG